MNTISQPYPDVSDHLLAKMTGFVSQYIIVHQSQASTFIRTWGGLRITHLKAGDNAVQF